MADMNEIEDGKVDRRRSGHEGHQGRRLRCRSASTSRSPAASSRTDFEPILERQIHHLINYAQGIMHIGQRDIAWIRVGKRRSRRASPEAHRRHPARQVPPGLRKIRRQGPGHPLHRRKRTWTSCCPAAREAYKTRDERRREDDRRGPWRPTTPAPSASPSPPATSAPSARSARGCAAPTTGWTARPPSRSTPPAPTSPSRRASASIPSSASGRASTSSSQGLPRRGHALQLLLHGLRPHDHLRLLRVHRGHAARLQRRHDRQPRLHRR
jgi:hypothetical protein